MLSSGFGEKIVIFFILLGICFSGGVAEDVLAGIVERGERGLMPVPASSRRLRLMSRVRALWMRLFKNSGFRYCVSVGQSGIRFYGHRVLRSAILSARGFVFVVLF